MSLDITSYQADLPEKAIFLGDMLLAENCIYAFDFDGVVSSSDDDDIYHLETWDGEQALLLDAARALKIRCTDMEMKYQRHLIYQACCLVLGSEIAPGIALSHIKRASEIGNVFVLTARSGWYAVERMRRFLNDIGVIPIEIFNVGRVKKDRQVDLLCREFSKSRVFYIEDNIAHLAAVSALGHENLDLVWAKRLNPKKSQDEMKKIVTSTIVRAISTI